MSTLPDFTGPGFFAGEAPDGLTTIAGTPTSAQVRVYWRDPADPQAPDVLVASTQSAADGTWQIAGLNPALRYVVRAQKSQFDDVTVVGAAPSRSDVIAYVNQLVPREDEFGDVDGLTGYVLLDSGLSPFTCEVIQPLPYGLTARIEGRKLLIEGSSTDNGQWSSLLRVTASNGVWVDVPVQVQIQVLRDPHFDKVSLLLHMDGADGSTVFIDSSPSSKTVTPHGNAQIGSAQSKFGGASAIFDGSNDYLSVLYDPSLDLLGDEAFTVESWIYARSINSSGSRILSLGGGVVDYNGTTGIHLLLQLRAGGVLNFQYLSTSGAIGVNTASVVPLNSWLHVAACYSPELGKIFVSVGGVVEQVSTPSPARPSSSPRLTIGTIPGENGNAPYGWNGYIDELRITKGVARYTANFTPPDKPFLNR